MGKGTLDVDHMTDSQICAAMGYMLLKSQDTKTADRPFLPTQEDFIAAANVYKAAKKKFDQAYCHHHG